MIGYNVFKILIRRSIYGILRKYPQSGLAEDNLYAYLDALLKKKSVKGSILEIGCANRGTAAIAKRFMERIGCDKEYFCIDTFSGFLEEQYVVDQSIVFLRNFCVTRANHEAIA